MKGETDEGEDCDDADDAVHPEADEQCDGIDNDCDGAIDESDAVDTSSWYADSDEDGYGDPGSSLQACSSPSGYLADDQDCNDTDALTHPGGTETCDGTDEDCDGEVDNDGVDAPTWTVDDDGDGFAAIGGATITSCDEPGSGWAIPAADSDDGNGAV